MLSAALVPAAIGIWLDEPVPDRPVLEVREDASIWPPPKLISNMFLFREPAD